MCVCMSTSSISVSPHHRLFRPALGYFFPGPVRIVDSNPNILLRNSPGKWLKCNDSHTHTRRWSSIAVETARIDGVAARCEYSRVLRTAKGTEIGEANSIICPSIVQCIRYVHVMVVVTMASTMGRASARRANGKKKCQHPENIISSRLYSTFWL